MRPKVHDQNRVNPSRWDPSPPLELHRLLHVLLIRKMLATARAESDESNTDDGPSCPVALWIDMVPR